MDAAQLSNIAANQIQSDLTEHSFSISPNMAAILCTLRNRPNCWKGVFTNCIAWYQAAAASEVATVWQSLITVCGLDGKAHAAYPMLWCHKSNAPGLLLLWNSLPSGANPYLQLELAANPLLLPQISSPPTALQNPIVASRTWTKVLNRMTVLSQYDGLGAR